MEAMRDLHLGNHKRDQFLAEKGIKPSFPLARTESPTIEEPPPKKSPEEYEVLLLDHINDENFLKVRGIKITEANATTKWRLEHKELTKEDVEFLKKAGIKHD
jgi:hypothetical protein